MRHNKTHNTISLKAPGSLRLRASNAKDGGFFFLPSRQLKDIYPQLARRKLQPIKKRSHRYQLLRSLVNEIRWGVGQRDKTGRKTITPANYKAAIIRRRVHRDGHNITINNEHIEKRFKGGLVYAAGSENYKRYSLLCLDVDYHTDHQDGKAEQIIKDAFGVTFVDPSRSGSHLWIVIDKVSSKGKLSNHKFRQEFEAIKDAIQRIQFPGVTVEVKSTLPYWIYDKRTGAIKDYNGGTFATIPLLDTDRQTRDFVNTPVFTIDELDQAVTRLQDLVPSKTQAHTPPIREMRCGSTPEFIFTDSDRLNFDKGFLPLAKSYLDKFDHKMRKPTGRDKVDVNDVAAMMLITNECSINPYDNGALPVGRIRRAWWALQDAEIIDRSFKPNRIAVIRDWLSDLGLIEWTDCKYHYYAEGHDKRGQGKAMQWSLTDQFLQEIKDLLSSIITTSVQAIRYTQTKSVVPNAPIIRPVLTIPLDDYQIEDKKQRQREQIIGKWPWHTAA